MSRMIYVGPYARCRVTMLGDQEKVDAAALTTDGALASHRIGRHRAFVPHAAGRGAPRPFCLDSARDWEEIFAGGQMQLEADWFIRAFAQELGLVRDAYGEKSVTAAAEHFRIEWGCFSIA